MNFHISGSLVSKNKYLEGAIFVKKEDFFKVNGYSLIYNDILFKLKLKEINLLENKNDWITVNKDIEYDLEDNPIYYPEDGYTNIKYKVHSESKILDFSEKEYLKLCNKYDYKSKILFEGNSFNLNKFKKLFEKSPTINIYSISIDF